MLQGPPRGHLICQQRFSTHRRSLSFSPSFSLFKFMVQLQASALGPRLRMIGLPSCSQKLLPPGPPGMPPCHASSLSLRIGRCWGACSLAVEMCCQCRRIYTLPTLIIKLPDGKFNSTWEYWHPSMTNQRGWDKQVMCCQCQSIRKTIPDTKYVVRICPFPGTKGFPPSPFYPFSFALFSNWTLA